jgi:hypothetical protein
MGKDNGALHALLEDTLAEQYEDLMLHPDDDFIIPDDFVNIIATTMAKTAKANENGIELRMQHRFAISLGIQQNLQGWRHQQPIR